MKIRDFLHDKNGQLEWLENEKRTSQDAAYYFSWWWHEKVEGFGIVVTGLDASMELHLMPDGEVTRHLEVFYPETKELKPLVSDSLQAITFEEFKNLYVDLRERTINYNS